MPKLDVKQLRLMCLKQEEAIIHHLIRIDNFDIYTEISKVCPSQSTLRNLTEEELTNKMNSVGQVDTYSNPSPASDADDMMT